MIFSRTKRAWKWKKKNIFSNFTLKKQTSKNVVDITFNFYQFYATWLKSFSYKKWSNVMKIYIDFIDKFHKFMSLITLKKYVILIYLSFIQSCNINLTNFLKLRTFNFELELLKGYLHCKTITSRKVSSEAQVKNFFTL